jgi:PII-like signaling protein
MTLPSEGSLLRIFIGESDRHAGMLLYEWIVRKAREHGLAGATVLRGVEGFGARSRVRTAKILELSTDLPIIVEIVDTAEKIEAFLPVIDGAIKDGMATVERVQIRFYRSGKDYVVDASFSGIATLVLYLYMENLIKNLK